MPDANNLISLYGALFHRACAKFTLFYIYYGRLSNQNPVRKEIDTNKQKIEKHTNLYMCMYTTVYVYTLHAKEGMESNTKYSVVHWSMSMANNRL